MYNRLIFFNEFGAGDIYESREFVKEIMTLIPAREYFYSHGKPPKILRDIPNLQFTKFTTEFDSMRDIVYLEDNSLAWNTWIGRDSQYVLPGIGTTVEEFYRMNNDMLRKMKFGKLSRNPIDYIPNIDFSYFPDIKNVDEFMSKHPEDKIIIDNGWVGSAQAPNFVWDEILYALSEIFADRLIITTQAMPTKLYNVYPIKEIINSEEEFNLTELSYLSQFCSVLIGRNSGPHVHMQNYNNCMDEKKKLLSFTYQVTGSSFVENTNIKMKKYWSPYEDDKEVIRRIVEVVNE